MREKLNNQKVFERLITAAFLLALVQGIYQLPKLRVTYSYWEAAFDAFAMPLITLLISLAVSRLRSRLAALIFLVTLLLTVAVVAFDFLDGQWLNLPYALGASSVVLECLAAWIVTRWLLTRKLGLRKQLQGQD